MDREQYLHDFFKRMQKKKMWKKKLLALGGGSCGCSRPFQNTNCISTAIEAALAAL